MNVTRKTEPRTYKLKHPFWSFDANGNLAGTRVFLERAVVAKTGNNYSGSFTFIAYNLNGNITAQVTNDVKAERITPD